MSVRRRRSIWASGLVRTNRCDWTAAASLLPRAKRRGSIVLSFARVRSHKGLTAWADPVSHRCVRFVLRDGLPIEPEAVLTLFWSRRVGMGPGAAAAGGRAVV
jgi:hypothetical protein